MASDKQIKHILIVWRLFMKSALFRTADNSSCCLAILITFANVCPSQIYTRYGKCYTFNSGKDGNPLLTTLKGGTGNGLEIMLDIQQDEYLPVWGETGKIYNLLTPISH